MKKIIITVSGVTGSGKSTVISLIKKILEQNDVDCCLGESVLKDYGDVEDFENAMHRRTLGEGDILNKNNTHVIIEEENLSKERLK